MSKRQWSEIEMSHCHLEYIGFTLSIAIGCQSFLLTFNILFIHTLTAGNLAVARPIRQSTAADWPPLKAATKGVTLALNWAAAWKGSPHRSSPPAIEVDWTALNRLEPFFFASE
jgi:hypothetical protein